MELYLLIKGMKIMNDFYYLLQHAIGALNERHSVSPAEHPESGEPCFLVNRWLYVTKLSTECAPDTYARNVHVERIRTDGSKCERTDTYDVCDIHALNAPTGTGPTGPCMQMPIHRYVIEEMRDEDLLFVDSIPFRGRTSEMNVIERVLKHLAKNEIDNIIINIYESLFEEVASC